jgi:hypothetical protein
MFPRRAFERDDGDGSAGFRDPQRQGSTWVATGMAAPLYAVLIVLIAALTEGGAWLARRFLASSGVFYLGARRKTAAQAGENRSTCSVALIDTMIEAIFQ